MAKREAAGAVKKPYSSKLLQMRFMQRGTQPAATAEEPSPTEKEATATETEWTSNWGPQAGCSVIVEADPLPGASRGRLSFHSFNPAAEKLQADAQIAEQEAQNPGGKSVSDAEMAERLETPKKKRRKDKEERQTEKQFTSKPGKGRYFD